MRRTELLQTGKANRWKLHDRIQMIRLMCHIHSMYKSYKSFDIAAVHWPWLMCWKSCSLHPPWCLWFCRNTVSCSVTHQIGGRALPSFAYILEKRENKRVELFFVSVRTNEKPAGNMTTRSLIHCTLGRGRLEGGDLLLIRHLVTGAVLIEFLSRVWTVSLDENADRHLSHHAGLLTQSQMDAGFHLRHIELLWFFLQWIPNTWCPLPRRGRGARLASTCS